jgi:hypothetical protein
LDTVILSDYQFSPISNDGNNNNVNNNNNGNSENSRVKILEKRISHLENLLYGFLNST